MRALAAARAARPFADPAPRQPESLARLTYDDLRCIAYDERRAVWRDEALPFRLMMYHLGGPHMTRGASLYAIEDGRSRDLPFRPSLFTYGAAAVPTNDLADVTDFAGFRALAQLNATNRFDEVVSFLGASYFRALGRGNIFGASARGICLDRGEKEAEEFPRFVAFWIARPAPRDTALEVFALLDGPSLSGAYRCRVTPGVDTTVAVSATLYARRPLARIGLGTLTSMFWHGENTPRRFDDFRPEVHDSDGLLVARGDGVWVWQPLRNDLCLRTTDFGDALPRGFGLLQRDRRFTSYEDIEARYHLRPSVWVEPGAGWGAGRVHLLEWPTHTEYADNIVACWQPDDVLAPGAPREVSWTLHWHTDSLAWPPQARCMNTFVTGRRVRLDFAGGNLPADDAAPPVAHVLCDNGRVQGLHVTRSPDTGWWRVGFDIEPVRADWESPLWVTLRDGAQQVLSETWTYRLTP